MTPVAVERFLTDTDLERMGLAKRQTFAKWRMQGRGPKFIKLPGGAIRYRESDVQAWVGAAAIDPRDRIRRAG